MKIYSTNGIKFLLALIILSSIAPRPAAAVVVDVELALLVDVSGSVTASNFDLQKTGYKQAFENSAIQTAIADGAIGSIAVSLIYWAGTNSQVMAVPWALIDSTASANAFADAVGATTRPGFIDSATAIGSALGFATQTFTGALGTGNGFEGTRLVIDVSGDGVDNVLDPSSFINLAYVRDLTLQTVETINGLPIGDQSLSDYYSNNVIGGPGAFVVQANSYADIGQAIVQKLEGDITGQLNTPVPVPGAAWLFGSGLLGLVGVVRRRKNVSHYNNGTTTAVFGSPLFVCAV